MLASIAVFLVVTAGNAGIVPAEKIAAQNRQPLVPDVHYAQLAVTCAKYLQREHLSHAPIDDSIASKAFTNYLDSLDYERMFFLQSDIDKFAEKQFQLDNMLLQGNTQPAYDMFSVFLERVTDRVEYASQLVSKGFDFDVKETYRWKRKNEAWAKDKSDWNELWRKRIKNEYLRNKINAETAKEKSNRDAKSGTTTNLLNSSTNAPLSPEASITKAYDQFLTMINDSDSEWVLQKYLTAFGNAYDFHTTYMSPSSMADFDIEMSLKLTGIGALLRAEEGAAKVEKIIPGGPADLDKSPNHLTAGDKIIAVAQEGKAAVDILHWPLNKAVKIIRGPKGTKVFLTVISAADATGSTIKTVELIRDEIKLEEQAARSKVYDVLGSDGKKRRLGVITLPDFYASMNLSVFDNSEARSATDDVAKIINNLSTQNIDGIVFDLRNNGGGALIEAIRMSGLFISTGPILQVKERYRMRCLYDDDPATAYSGPMIMLVNKLSASASEIMAGALQDYGRCLIVGDSRTHGKGTVQTVLELDKQPCYGSLKVTTSGYYRITGKATQLNGVIPDIILPSAFDFMDIGENALPNPLSFQAEREALYHPVGDVKVYIPDLANNSQLRINSDQLFVAYKKLLTKIEEMTKNPEMPLDYKSRVKMLKTEEELARLQEDLASDSKDEQTNDLAKDLILREGLNILGDLIIMTEKGNGGLPPPRVPEKGFFEKVDKFFRDMLGA